jgi:tight adherence protein B
MSTRIPRPRRLLASAATIALAGLTLIGPAPAYADGETNIDHVEMAPDGTVSAVLALDGLPAGAAPDPESVEVRVDGTVVTAGAEPVDGVDITRTAVLVLDASRSMRGTRFAAAQEAARAFLAAAPDDLRVGLLTFAGGVHVHTEPTTDHAVVAEAIDTIALAGGTRVYDAVIAGAELAGADGARSVLVLSDGRDQGRGSTLAQAARTAAEAGAVVDVVSMSDDPADSALLSEIADATGGRVVPSEPRLLTRTFRDQADAYASQWLVRFQRPVGAGSEAEIAVSVAAGDASYADTALVALPAVDRGLAAAAPGRAGLGMPALLAGAVALAVGLTFLVWTAIGGARRGPTLAQRQIAFFSGEALPDAAPGRRTGAVEGVNLRDSAVAVAQRVVEGDLEDRLLLRLQGAGSRLTAAEWLLLHAGIAVGAAFVGFVLHGPLLGVLLLGAGVVAPWGWLRWRHRRRGAAFHEQLPETLQLIAGGLSAGLSMPQSIDTVVAEGAEPMRGEMRRALAETRLGVDLPDALSGIAQRMSSPDFGWVVMAIQIQREVGGNLAELLTTVSDTLREREHLRRQVRVLSAEGRMSAYVLGALPPGLFCYMLFVRPEFVRPLYTTVPGFLMLGAAGVLLTLGFVVMSRLVRIEV